MRTDVMSKFYLTLLFAIVLTATYLLSSTANAADMTPAKIAVLNVQEILKQSKAAESARKQIDAKRDQYQGEVKKLEDQLRKEDQALAEQRNLLSPEALEQKRNEFRTKITDAQRSAQEKKFRLDAAYAKALDDIQAAVTKIVEGMTSAKGYNLVVPTSTLVYATPELDITADVLAQLDKDLPKIAIDFNTPLPTKEAK